MSTAVYLNGEFVAPQDARVTVYDGGFLHGAGLFETMRAENKRIFRLESHMARLRRSAAQILAPLTPDALPSAEVFAELLERNGLSVARVRLTLTAGSLRDQDEADGPAATLCATAAPLSSYPPELYQQGVQVAVCDFRQSTTDPIAGHKTTAYLPRLLGLRQARQRRCLEAIWFNTRNQLAEGSISNVFLVTRGVLRTPPLDTPVLPGIARSVVLKLAEGEGVRCDEAPLTVDDLLDADEVFITNAIMQVMPVIRVERHDIADSRVGPLTGRLLEGYRDLVRQECGP
jgi:branched-chain amino acid aminotransferase